MKRALAALALLALAATAQAAPVRITGEVRSGASLTPLAGVTVDLEVGGRFITNAATTDANGRYNAEADAPAAAPGRKTTVIARLSKNGFDRADRVQQCNFAAAPQCQLATAQLTPLADTTTLSATDRAALASQRSKEGNTLFLLPYRVLPEQQAPALNMNALTRALHRSITTRLQELEADPGLLDFPPLNPVGLVTLQGVAEASDLERIKAIGTEVNALAMISGTGEVGADRRVRVDSNFYIMPPVQGDSARLLLVSDEGLPASLLNSATLADRLSPEWGHNALIALSLREYTRAKAAGDRQGLRRVRAYLIAERSRAGNDERLKVADLNRLVRLIDQELRP